MGSLLWQLLRALRMVLGPSKHRTTAALASHLEADSCRRTVPFGSVWEREGTGSAGGPRSLEKRILLSTAG